MIRDYRRANYKAEKIVVGMSTDGIERIVWVCTEDLYMDHGRAKYGEWRERELALRVRLGVIRDGIAVIWTPGWGVDIHYPRSKRPTYLADYGPSKEKCEFIGETCWCDGSSLADAELGWLNFRSGGTAAVFSKLEELLRDAEREVEEERQKVVV